MPAGILENVSIVQRGTTFLGAMAGALSTLEGACPLIWELAGKTGFAFRLDVREDVDGSAPCWIGTTRVDNA